MMLKRCLIVLAVAALSLSACSSGDGDDGAAAGTGLLVATSPRTEPVVKEVVDAFKRANPDAEVTVAVQGTQALRAGITNRTGIVILPKLWLQPPPTGVPTGSFGRTMTTIAVPSANPKNITSTAAFRPGSGLKTRVCGPNSLFGNFGVLALGRSNVVPDASTVGADCEDEALEQIADGDLDALFFFRDAAQVPAGVELVDIPPAQNLVFDHSFVVAGTTPDARAFGTFLASPEVRQILTRDGLLP